MAQSKLKKKITDVIEPSYKPGQKVKVYSEAAFRSQEVVRFGEVVGVREVDGKILLTEHPSFASLPVSAFKHFRTTAQVVFIDDLIVADGYIAEGTKISIVKYKEIKK
jgi:hypothetical protein